MTSSPWPRIVRAAHDALPDGTEVRLGQVRAILTGWARIYAAVGPAAFADQKVIAAEAAVGTGVTAVEARLILDACAEDAALVIPPPRPTRVPGRRPRPARLITARVLDELDRERDAQEARWGEQDHPDGTGESIAWMPTVAALAAMGWSPRAADVRDFIRHRTNGNAKRGLLTFLDILVEEVAEACAESDEEALRAELVQVGAVAVAWIEAIDRRRVKP